MSSSSGLSNAFNSIDCSIMFEEIHSRIPSIAAWMECCYGSQAFLHLGRQTILSCCGPLGFGLALNSVIERFKREVPDLLINV